MVNNSMTGEKVWAVCRPDYVPLGIFYSEVKALQFAKDMDLGVPDLPKDYLDYGSLLDVELKKGFFQDWTVDYDHWHSRFVKGETL